MSSTELRRKRYALREVDPYTGRLISKIAPESAHGRSMGSVGYGCFCAPCREWQRAAREETQERKFYNWAVMRGLIPIEESPRAEPVIDSSGFKKLEAAVLAQLDKSPPRVVERPAPKAPPEAPPKKLPDVRIPPLSASVEAQLKGTGEQGLSILEEISRAYFEPSWSSHKSNGTEKRARDGMAIIVDPRKGNTVEWFRKTFPTQEPIAEPLKPRGIPRAKGGRGGSGKPTTHRELVKKLTQNGATVEKTNAGHLKVKGEDGGSLTLGTTNSDHRALMNAVAEAKRQGLLP